MRLSSLSTYSFYSALLDQLSVIIEIGSYYLGINKYSNLRHLPLLQVSSSNSLYKSNKATKWHLQFQVSRIQLLYLLTIQLHTILLINPAPHQRIYTSRISMSQYRLESRSFNQSCQFEPITFHHQTWLRSFQTLNTTFI